MHFNDIWDMSVRYITSIHIFILINIYTSLSLQWTTALKFDINIRLVPVNSKLMVNIVCQPVGNTICAHNEVSYINFDFDIYDTAVVWHN